MNLKKVEKNGLKMKNELEYSKMKGKMLDAMNQVEPTECLAEMLLWSMT